MKLFSEKESTIKPIYVIYKYVKKLYLSKEEEKRNE